MAGRCLTHKGVGVNVSECEHWKDVAFHPGFQGTTPSFGAPTPTCSGLSCCLLFFYLWLIDVLKIFGEMISTEEKASQTLCILGLASHSSFLM